MTQINTHINGDDSLGKPCYNNIILNKVSKIIFLVLLMLILIILALYIYHSGIWDNYYRFFTGRDQNG